MNGLKLAQLLGQPCNFYACVTFFVFRFFLRFSWRRILAVVLIRDVTSSDSELVSIILDVSLQRKARPHVQHDSARQSLKVKSTGLTQNLGQV